MTTPLDERPPPKILHRCLFASSASSAVDVVVSGWQERCDLERKKARFLFNFFFSGLCGLISPIAQHASPSHGEGVVCFCGQTALLRAGGRAKGRVGLLKRMLRKSGAGVHVLKANFSVECRQKNSQQVCSHVFEEKWFLMFSALHGAWSSHTWKCVHHTYSHS